MIIPRAVLAAALLASCAIGCGQPQARQRSLDEAIARQALADALDGWKSGRPHATPSESDPRLRVADEDWLGGARLIDYRILPGDRVIGPRWNCPVALVIDLPGGRRVKQHVSYAVGTDPAPSVIRQD